tara:strand:- start:251 stop:1108 length:858 start_codon:yes stop_codon:yes gene_type:complete
MDLEITKKPEWSNEEIKAEIENFIEIYSERPIKNNEFGMKFPHMFAFYFILKKMKPEFVIESGVYKGQSTWLIERILPNTRILSIDIKLHYREYISNKAEYSNLDFKFQDFSKIDPEKTLAFFDDHQNSLERLKECKWFGIKHVIFEDNYPTNKGDFYSLRQIISGTGFKIHKNIFYERLKGIMIFLLFQFNSFFKEKYPLIDHHRFRANHVAPNITDLKYLNKNIEIYYEFPPIFKPIKSLTENIEYDNYKIDEPLLGDEKKNKYQIAFDEKDHYNWFTYLRLY